MAFNSPQPKISSFLYRLNCTPKLEQPVDRRLCFRVQEYSLVGNTLSLSVNKNKFNSEKLEIGRNYLFEIEDRSKDISERSTFIYYHLEAFEVQKEIETYTVILYVKEIE